MPKAKLISPVSKQNVQKTRVAAYCRVSSNSADQLNSYATQIRAYTKMIKSRTDWELVEIFADEGLSGMKAENRTEFQRMIRLCELRQIPLMYIRIVCFKEASVLCVPLRYNIFIVSKEYLSVIR